VNTIRSASKNKSKLNKNSEEKNKKLILKMIKEEIIILFHKKINKKKIIIKLRNKMKILIKKKINKVILME